MIDESPKSIDLPRAQGRVDMREKSPPSSGRSIFPAAISEAKGAKLSVSLFLVLALIGGSYAVGRSAGRDVSDSQMAALTSVQDKRLEQISNSLQALAEITKLQAQDTNANFQRMDSRLHTVAAETQVIKSHVAR
jgi:hypothetical protein